MEEVFLAHSMLVKINVMNAYNAVSMHKSQWPGNLAAGSPLIELISFASKPGSAIYALRAIKQLLSLSEP